MVLLMIKFATLFVAWLQSALLKHLTPIIANFKWMIMSHLSNSISGQLLWGFIT